ncbi:hypothetical protein CONLIGDRAFT_408171 [Coniochaeta ligniaria NRRL 30616]|uniref:C2H2-type domain-containing protein n=1 Tax=Coniochaeta ligniaria NRRL 30616 TaxID=1408157 RepID=A0A1J7IPM9_9PEZI|nr:hypothetical protein CONLIGDRAFT_408171 [Coniochaeta ligniaria NRRL 30616]
MASNRRKTANPAIQQESACPGSSSFPAEAANMARTDSGYYSTPSNHPGYYGDPSSALQEEAEDYQGDDTAMNWQYYNMEGVEATYDQQQYSNYIVEGAGSHMTGYYQDDSTPRTSVVDHGYEASQDMDLDDTNDTYFKVEQQWPADMDTVPHYQQESYHPHAESSTVSPTPTETDPSQATFFDTNTPPTVTLTTPASRRRLPNKKPPTNKSPPSDDKHQIALVSPTTTTTTTTTTTNKFPCLMPACNKQFNRAADLDRHMKFIHCKDKVRPWLCSYRRCPRHKTPFHRADHFRDHLRDQHKEDLLKRGEAGGAPDAAWWRGRAPGAVYGGHWRCSKCFATVNVEREGWQCGGGVEGGGGCGNFCETERQAVRRLPIVCDHFSCELKGPGERETFLSPGKFREHLRSVHGDDVPCKEGKEGEKELMDEAWRGSRDATLVYGTKWRCTRCLDAVDSTVDGFECPRCGFACEEVRRQWHGGFQWED